MREGGEKEKIGGECEEGRGMRRGEDEEERGMDKGVSLSYWLVLVL